MLKDQKDITMDTQCEGKNDTTVKEEENCDPKKFDFSFNPKRDARLIARNANKIIGGNPVTQNALDKESLMRYWQQRYRLFSKINDGIIMDEQGWFSVTPEMLAKYTANRLIPHKNAIILDAFCGAGGNAIQFALAGAYVYAIDLDPIKLRCALQNAKVYGVQNQITFICGNFFHIAKSFFKERSANGSPIIDGIMLSPPWGGPEYYNAPVFELEMCSPDGIEIFDYCLKISQNIAYFLPKQTSAKQLIQLAAKTDSKNVEIEHNILNSKIKTLTAYFGNVAKK
uniref:Trimethylguanosine synthase n=1 Tax=Panagrolaimus davidi TaxID=227884 RepID=A0A914P2X6_9BILA